MNYNKIKLSLVLALILVTAYTFAAINAFHNRAHEIEPNNVDIDPAINLDDNSDPHLAALRKAIWHVVRSHEELRDIQIPESWEYQVLTPDGFCGFFETQYTGEGWNVTIGNPVVPDPTYTVEIDCTVGEVFYWKGTVDHDGNVEEITYTRVS